MLNQMQETRDALISQFAKDQEEVNQVWEEAMRDALADKETQLTKVSADRKAAERLAQANATALGVASVDTAAKLRSFRDALHVSEAAVAMLYSTNTALEQRAKEAE